ncbi:hypothetical protein RN001_011597 [Aquatica leii]|uniref:DUF229 domain containing protein n=1 Tax=Aquatica leii TaxID=1421715 RepID=A0AAN7SP52_9COLE|nr:hypothetical protein RN001_011597 [Aquatica leii]
MFYKKGLIGVMVLSVSVYVLYTYTSQDTFLINIQNESFKSSFKDGRYLVSGSKCKIPNFEPFNQDVISFHKQKEYMNCSNLPLLSFVAHDKNNYVLHINETAIAFYATLNLSCCYSYVSRFSANPNDFDKEVRMTKCTEFEKNVTVTEDIVYVECKNATNPKIYSNIHAIIRTENKTINKTKPTGNETHISVLLIGIDSVSRLSLIRSLPKTHSFLQEHEWLELRGYNKIGDNTFPNLMAILTGKNESKAYDTCVTPGKPFDNCNILWYDYRNLGYVTAYAEDEASINTFHFNKKGFNNTPTDYYLRPYLLANEKFLESVVVDSMKYCTGPETTGERILNVLRDFANTFAKYLYFGFFWMNSFSHNDINSVSRMDTKLYGLLDELVKSQVLNNTIVFFFSDHGIRFGTFRYSTSGWLEERLPFFYIYIPETFKKTYALYYDNLKINRDKLTTPYDFYMTLQDILAMTTQRYVVQPGNACPQCQSFFKPISNNRSCDDAAINEHWCTCLDYRPHPIDSKVISAAKYVITRIHSTIKSYGPKEYKKCQTYKYNKVLSSSISKDFYKNSSYLLVLFKTTPGSIFEATVGFETEQPNSFRLEGEVSRLDFYRTHSKCVDDSILKKYCYCR